MEIEPEHFQNDHYAYARREWSDSMFIEFMEKYMPSKDKRGFVARFAIR
jgi:hypothetical protein